MANVDEIKVYFQPLASAYLYDDEVDVSEYIDTESLPTIKEFIDSEDYDFGMFSSSDIEFLCSNDTGIFNDPEDPRSMFPFIRDLCKVRIVFVETEVEYDDNHTTTNQTITETTLFNGLIQDIATRQDIVANTVYFRILSREAVLSLEKIDEGEIETGYTANQIIQTCLTKPKTEMVFSFSEDLIDPDNDFVVDIPSAFDNRDTFDVLREVIPAANSIFMINSDGNPVVRDRAESDASVLFLYGPHDVQGRENILSLQNYNNGFHRMINSARVGSVEINDLAHALEYGLRQKEVGITFTEDRDELLTILSAIVEEFKIPRIECEVTVPLSIGKSASLLQKVSVNYPFQLEKSGDFYSLLGDNSYSEEEAPYARVFGSIEINPTIMFKIIEKRHDIGSRETTLKIRQAGTTYEEGYF